MEVHGGNKLIKPTVSKVKRKVILLEHKLQRKESVWKTKEKSLLIDSLLRGYVVPPIYTIVDENGQYVIDGVQRLSTLNNFYADEFALSKDLKPVIIEGTEYEIAGKKYSKLDQIVKDTLDGASLVIYEISKYTDLEVREMFGRLNSGKPLNVVQKLPVIMSDDMIDVVMDLKNMNLLRFRLTEAQLKQAVDIAVAIETLMLCSTDDEHDFTSFSGADKKKFIHYYNENIDPDKIALLESGMQELDKGLEEGTKIPKTSFSVILYAAYRVKKDNKDFGKFVETVKEFLSNYDENTEYKNNVQSGTNSSASVRYRFDYWRELIKTL